MAEKDLRYYLSKVRYLANKHMFIKEKITTRDLERFSTLVDPKGKALIVFSEFDHDKIFEDYDEMPHHLFETCKYLKYFDDYPAKTYDSVICMGLLEHMKDPSKLIEKCHSTLKPGGKVYISASSVFSIHRGPENYFHVTHYGAEALMKKFEWSHLEIKGSCGPFRTLGILCQRILLQSEINIIFKPFLELLAWSLPLLDIVVKKQYDGHRREEERVIDSMMPSNIWIIGTK
jgi:SAM-dependent methyltransferase